MTSVARRVMRHVPVVLRGRPLHGTERYGPFFVVGSGRCGTNLLRAVLEAHPSLHVPPENPLAGVFRTYRRYSRLPWGVVVRLVLGQFEFRSDWELFDLALAPVFRALRESPPPARDLAAVLDTLYRAHTVRHKPEATRWGDKTPANTHCLPDLRATFPDLRVVHMVRDGRDVVRSFLERATPLTLEFAADYWLTAVLTARRFGARHAEQYLEIRYEDLVGDPRSAIERIAAFLDVSFHERMLRHHELDLPLGFRSWRSTEGVLDSIHQNAVGRWRRYFDVAQIAELHARLGPTLEALGYEVDPTIRETSPAG